MAKTEAREEVPAERKQWERPALRRLAANAAENGSGATDDGNEHSGSNVKNHS